MDSSEMQWASSEVLGVGVCPIYDKNPKGGSYDVVGGIDRLKAVCICKCNLLLLLPLLWFAAFVHMLSLIHYALRGGVGCFSLGNIATWQHSRPTIYISAALIGASHLPELQHHWQGVALIQSHVSHLPTPKPVRRDRPTHLVGRS